MRYALLAAVIILVAGCRSNQNNPVPHANGYSGRLYARVGVVAPDTDGLVDAEFFSQPVDLYSSAQGIRVAVNSLLGNGTKVAVQSESFDPNYYDRIHNVTNGVTWQVSGDNGIPSFTWPDSGPFPQITGTLPDTIFQSRGLSFDFTAGRTTDADSVTVWVEGATQGEKGIRLPGTIYFSPNELIPGPNGLTGTISIWLGKLSTATFDGKKFASIKIRQVMYDCVVR